MSTSKPPTAGHAPDGMEPFDPFAPIPQPDVVEKSSETTWELWAEVRDKEHARYADTVPMTQAGAPSPLTRPGTHPGAPIQPAAVSGATGLDKLLEECKRNNRVCPKPVQWQAFDAMLRARGQAAALVRLAAPLSPIDWRDTTSLAKRLIFRSVIDWAAANALTEDALQFVRALPEDQWHHMGD
ncbi:MAG: hypothetical protein K0Q43_1739 [Ramlibacter sp.]|jgi:hypothetical protein|nr:hypothetical protein [Ramlibacter sp.]